jgi:hypothetical protein
VISGLGKGKYKVSLEHFVVPEIKEFFLVWDFLKEHRNQPERVPNGQSGSNLNNKMKNNSIQS